MSDSHDNQVFICNANGFENMRNLKWLFYGVICLNLVLLPCLSFADAYLDAVSAEAEAPSPILSKNKTDYHELDKLLLDKMPTTHKIFMKLTDPHKQQVLALFMKDKELAPVSKKIFDLYLLENK